MPDGADLPPAPTPEEAAPEEDPAPVEPEPEPMTFDESMVRSVAVDKEAKGGQANVAVVAESTDVQVLQEVGLGCVDHYLQEQKAAFCHVWGSELDYAARDPQGIGDLMCWVYFIGVPLAGGEPIVTEGGAVGYTVSACPGGVLPYV